MSLLRCSVKCKYRIFFVGLHPSISWQKGKGEEELKKKLFANLRFVALYNAVMTSLHHVVYFLWHHLLRYVAIVNIAVYC